MVQGKKLVHSGPTWNYVFKEEATERIHLFCTDMKMERSIGILLSQRESIRVDKNSPSVKQYCALALDF